MQRIRICEESEARALYRDGLFFPFIRKHLEAYPKGKLILIKEYKKKFGCDLLEAKKLADTIASSTADCTLLEYGEKGAIRCGDCTPKLLRKLGNVWVPICSFDEEITFHSFFEDIQVLPVNRLKGPITGKDTEGTAFALNREIHYYLNIFHKVSDNEIWIIKKDGLNNAYAEIYRPGSLEPERIGTFKEVEIKRYLDKRRARYKSSFGVF